MLHPARNIVRSLPQVSRDKLVKCLKEATFEELAALPGIGAGKMGLLLGIHCYCYNLDFVREFVQEHRLPWPTFRATSKAVFVRPGIRSVGSGPAYDSSPQNITRKIFNRKDTIWSLLEHFGISPEVDVNDTLTELRDIRVRLSFFKEVGDPVVQDYLRRLTHELAQPQRIGT